MNDADRKPSLGMLLPWVAALLVAAGAYVDSLPLKSQRPADEDRAKFAHVGRQDVEARLWQDPFSTLPLKPMPSADGRCEDAIRDKAHHLTTLSGQVAYRQDTFRQEVELLGVMVPGGPYFEDGESRRRYRYAAVSGLLNSGWTPVQGDKLGYAWTFESCIGEPWLRRVPEVLPYEWFEKDPGTANDNGHRKKALLVLWLEEDALSRRPLRGMERVLGLIGDPKAVLCGAAAKPQCGLGGLPPAEAGKLQGRLKTGVCSNPDPVATSSPATPRATDRFGCALPANRTAVIGPGTTDTLGGMVRDLADAAQEARSPARGQRFPATTPEMLRFISSGATTPYVPESEYESESGGFLKARKDAGGLDLAIALRDAAKRARWECERWAGQAVERRLRCTSAFDEKKVSQRGVAELREALDARVVRLTTTDDKLSEAFFRELKLRLSDPGPFSWLGANAGKATLCDATIAIVAEQGSEYAQGFSRELANQAAKDVGGCKPGVRLFGYLRGVDGILPEGKADSEKPDASSERSLTRTADTFSDRKDSDRAEGRTQYDYISRLAQHLMEVDESEHRQNRAGIRAIGVMGNDVYDKLVVLDALRPRFPRAAFFAADLDARLIGGKAAASTRNLIVASAYGLALHPDLQGQAPLFRDTYQTGMFFATQVATEDGLATDPGLLKTLFGQAQTFEIGRTQAIPLNARRDRGRCAIDGLASGKCQSIHPAVRENSDTPWPAPVTVAILVLVLLLSSTLLGLTSTTIRREVTNVWTVDDRGSRKLNWGSLPILGTGFLAVFLLLGAIAWWLLWQDAVSSEGEPLAWFEGVSIWPTEIIRSVALAGIWLMMIFGRRCLRKNIDRVAEDFRLTSFTERQRTPLDKESLRAHPIGWLWWFDPEPPRDNASNDAAARRPRDTLWLRYLDSMRMGPCVTRMAIGSLLFLTGAVAVLGFDWPRGPHRGSFAAGVDQLMLIALLASVIALLFAALDSSLMVARLLDHVADHTRKEQFWAPADIYWSKYEAGEPYIRPLVTFHCAVKLAEAVNNFVYLPFAAFLLLLPARSHFFDAWNFPWPLLAVVIAAGLLAVLAAARLRRSAAKLRSRILIDLDQKTEKDRNRARRAPPRTTKDDVHARLYQTPTETALKEIRIEGMQDSANPAYIFWEEQAGRIGDIPRQLRATFIQTITEEIRSTKQGPFRSFWEEPVARAVMFLLGGSGTISLVEYFFFKGF